MRDDVIYGVVNSAQISDALDNFRMSRLFALPPAVAVTAEIVVLTVTSAESEYGFVFYGENLSAHKMNNIWRDTVNLSAVPFGDRQTFEHIKVFVTAVNESNGIVF